MSNSYFPSSLALSNIPSSSAELRLWHCEHLHSYYRAISKDTSEHVVHWCVDAAPAPAAVPNQSLLIPKEGATQMKLWNAAAIIGAIFPVSHTTEIIRLKQRSPSTFPAETLLFTVSAQRGGHHHNERQTRRLGNIDLWRSRAVWC